MVAKMNVVGLAQALSLMQTSASSCLNLAMGSGKAHLYFLSLWALGESEPQPNLNSVHFSVISITIRKLVTCCDRQHSHSYLQPFLR